MNVAFLFNSDSSDLGSYYGLPIMKKIINAGVLQKTNRHMKISIGDVSTYGRLETLNQLRSVYQARTWDRRKVDALEKALNKVTIFCWMFQNIQKDSAQKLHDALFEEPSYLGAIELDYTYIPHFAFFANGLMERYRLHDGACSVFYSMGEHEGPDAADEEIFGKAGFTVKYEDIGARHTIFDSYYDSLDHQNRTGHFQKFFCETLKWSDDDVSELTLNLNEIHPYLFNILFASSIALENAEVKEQLSQAYLSGRRFIEHFANFLFPPQEEQFLGSDGKLRDVKQDNYINRLAAYLQTTLNKANKAEEISLLLAYGKTIHDLYKDFCKGVHKPFSDEDEFKDERDRCEKAISELGAWIIKVINIDPSAIRRPYLAYNREILKLFSKVIADRA